MRRRGRRKKRVEVVQGFFNAPPPVTQDYKDQLAAFGFTPEQIKIECQQAEQILYIFEENWPAVMWFLDCQDCYRFSDNGVCLGLDMPQVLAEKQLSGREVGKDDFNFLKEMARENTRLLNRSLEKRTEPSKPKYAAPPD